MKLEEAKTKVTEIANIWKLYENTTESKQVLKFLSELGEYADAILANDTEAIKDAIGDMTVCIINAEAMANKRFNYNFDFYWLENLLYGIRTNKFSGCFFSLNLISKANNVELEECLDSVIEIISKRKGQMVNGVFVKEK